MKQMDLQGLTRADVSKSVTWKICNRIYRAAHHRVANYARSVRDEIKRAGTVAHVSSSTDFVERLDGLTEEINREWLLARPDLQRFSRLVADWEELYMSGLRAERGELHVENSSSSTRQNGP